MTQTSAYELRPYKPFYIISSCLIICWFILFLIACVCFFSYGMWEMLCAMGLVFIPVIILFYTSQKANKTVIHFNSTGFEIHNGDTVSYKECWHDYKGIYWAHSIYGHPYILIFPDRLTETERRKICNKAEFQYKFTPAVSGGFVIFDTLCKGRKYKDIIPFTA